MNAHPDVAHYHFRLAEALEAGGHARDACESYFAAVTLAPDVQIFRQRAAAAALSAYALDEAVERFSRLPRTTEEADGADLYMVTRLLAARRPELCQGPFRRAFGARVREIRWSQEAFGAHSVRIHFDGAARDIEFSADFNPWPFLFERLAAFNGYCDRIDNLTAQAHLALGDGPDGDQRQLCFSSDDPDQLLVPDPIFLATDAYAAFRPGADVGIRPWASRERLGYWRGGLTGVASGLKEAMGLPRVGLCLRALHSPLLDAKITDLSQFSTLQPVLGQALSGVSVLGEREPPERNFDYQFLIDVDGNTNAWQSLFMKLVAGGCVIKVRSPYRQWYYDKVKDSDTVVMVDSVNEVAEAVAWGLKHQKAAEGVARHGAAMVGRMSVETEWTTFADAVRRVAKT